MHLPSMARISLVLALATACAAPLSTGVDGAWPLAGTARVTDAPRAMVVSGSPIASAVGRDILAAGGNAVDAAVAVGLALAVVHPSAGNLGGGGFMVIRMADGTVRALDYRETAPLAATRDMYLDQGGDPTDLSITGHLAAGVPGSVAGMMEAHRTYGRLPFEPGHRTQPSSSRPAGSRSTASAAIRSTPTENGCSCFPARAWRSCPMAAHRLEG